MAAAAALRAKKKQHNDEDLEKMFNTHDKVAIDFIPGLDDELKVIMPGLKRIFWSVLVTSVLMPLFLI